MVSIIWALVALCTGLLCYLLPPMVAPMLPPDLRTKVGRYYYRNAMRSFRQVSIVRRQMSGYELLPISVDDQQRLAKVTLSSGMISDDKELPFKDPIDGIGRLFQKSLAVVPEDLPAAVDAKWSELGYWRRQQTLNEGAERVVDQDQQGRQIVEVNPWIKVSTGLRIADPRDIKSLVGESVEPENLKTTEEMTRQRFSKYGPRTGLASTAGLLTGFGFGAGAVGVLAYIRSNLIDGGGGGGGGPTNPLPPIGGIAFPAVDVAEVATTALEIMVVVGV